VLERSTVPGLELVGKSRITDEMSPKHDEAVGLVRVVPCWGTLKA
jgi:hypothetical protein